MKVIVTATAPELDAPVDRRFGRAAWFLVVDTESLDWQAHRNGALDAPSGAGSQAAQFVATHGAEVVVSGDFGPNAYTALSAAGIRMVLLGSAGTVREAVAAFSAGQLEEVSGPTGPGRHGGQ